MSVLVKCCHCNDSDDPSSSSSSSSSGSSGSSGSSVEGSSGSSGSGSSGSSGIGLTDFTDCLCDGVPGRFNVRTSDARYLAAVPTGSEIEHYPTEFNLVRYMSQPGAALQDFRAAWLSEELIFDIPRTSIYGLGIREQALVPPRAQLTFGSRFIPGSVPGVHSVDFETGAESAIHQAVLWIDIDCRWNFRLFGTGSESPNFPSARSIIDGDSTCLQPVFDLFVPPSPNSFPLFSRTVTWTGASTDNNPFIDVAPV